MVESNIKRAIKIYTYKNKRISENIKERKI